MCQFRKTSDISGQLEVRTNSTAEIASVRCRNGAEYGPESGPRIWFDGISVNGNIERGETEQESHKLGLHKQTLISLKKAVRRQKTMKTAKTCCAKVVCILKRLRSNLRKRSWQCIQRTMLGNEDKSSKTLFCTGKRTTPVIPSSLWC